MQACDTYRHPVCLEARLSLCVLIYRNNKALDSCGNARNNLQSTLQRVRSEG